MISTTVSTVHIFLRKYSIVAFNTSFHQSIRFYQPPPSGSINILRRRTKNYPSQFPTLRSKPLATLFLMFFSIVTLPYIVIHLISAAK